MQASIGRAATKNPQLARWCGNVHNVPARNADLPCLSVFCPAGIKRKSGKKKPADGGRKGELFSGDGTGKSKSSADGGAGKDGGAGAGRDAKGGKALKGGHKVDSGGMVKVLSKTELNKIKRGGKGKSSFKSKSKFKRKK